MCERCLDSGTWSAELGEATQCEVAECEEEAISLIRTQYVDVHLCKDYVDYDSDELSRGNVFRQSGQLSRDFLPIEQKVSCAYQVFHPLLNENYDGPHTRCRRLATHAKVIMKHGSFARCTELCSAHPRTGASSWCHHVGAITSFPHFHNGNMERFSRHASHP